MAPNRHLVGAAGAVSGLVALSLHWVSTEAVGGQSIRAFWGDLSAPSLSLAVAAVAAWGASSLSSGTLLRSLGIIQGGLASAGLFALVASFDTPQQALATLAREVTGLDLGIGSLSSELAWNYLGPALAIVCLLGLLVGGIQAGLTRSSPEAASGNRFERSVSDSADPWDQLSQGVDPTER